MEEQKSIIELIDSYEAACAYLGEDPNNLPSMTGPDAERYINMVKLERITKALNEKRTIDLYDTVYVPWTVLYSRDEYQSALKKGRTDLIPMTGPCSGLGAAATYGSFAGLASLSAYYRVSISYAFWGFRLCHLKRETCDYALRTWPELYNSLL